MQFCPSCGMKVVNEDWNFCPSCGGPLSFAAQEARPVEEEATEDVVFAPAHARRCRQLAMGSLLEQGKMAEVELAVADAYLPVSSEEVEHLGCAFNPNYPPSPDAWVPPDCAWAFFSYPGPVPTISGMTLRKKLNQLGRLAGRPLSEIIGIVGQPFSRQNEEDGIIVTWNSAAFIPYTVTIQFDKYGICLRVLGETQI